MKNNSITQLVDKLGRPLNVLRLSVTDRCNFNCVYCMPDKNITFLPKHKILSFEQICRVVKALCKLGLKKIKITGGEPTLRIGVDKLITMLCSIANIEDIALITNGVFLKTLASRLKRSGLTRITVSLDAMNNRVFQKIVGNTHSVHPILQGIEEALQQGFSPIKINCVIQRGINEDQILPLVEYFLHPQYHLRFIEYMDVGSIDWKQKDMLSSLEILAKIEKKYNLQKIDPSFVGEVATRYKYSNGKGEVGFISSVTQPFCKDCNRLRLTADGSLYGCLFSSNGANIKSFLDSNGSDEELVDILATFWKQREDRYSEERWERRNDKNMKKVAMNFIGG